MATAKRLKLPTAYALAASADGSLVAALGRDVVIASSSVMRRLYSSHPVSNPSDACFNNEGTQLAIKSTSGHIVVLRTVDSAVLCDHANQHEGEGSALHFSPCGEYLIDGSWDGRISVRAAVQPGTTTEIAFDNEMITVASPSANRLLWLFCHQPKAKGGANRPAPPYLTLWQWPLSRPDATIRPGFDNIYSAALSPDGTLVALVGYDHSTQQTELRMISIAGELLSSRLVSTGGTGNSLRWSPDGAFVGSVQDRRIAVYLSAELSEVAAFGFENPSDICFAADHSYIALGTWGFGLIERLSDETPNPSIERTSQRLRLCAAAHVKR